MNNHTQVKLSPGCLCGIAALLLVALAGCATSPAPEPIDARAIRGEYMLNRAAIWTADDAEHFEANYIERSTHTPTK